jgi:hypothetical protein
MTDQTASTAALADSAETTEGKETTQHAGEKKSRRIRKSNKRTFHTYISRSLHKRMNKDGRPIGANRHAARVLENATSAFMDSFISNQCNLARLSGHSTVDEHVVFATVRLMVPRQLAPVFIEAAKTAADTFIQSAAAPADAGAAASAAEDSAA